MEPFSIESCTRGYQVYKGIWEASIGEEPHRHGNGEVRASLLQSQHEWRLVTEDPVDPGHMSTGGTQVL